MPELTKIQTGFLEPQGPFKLDPGTESAPGIYLEGDENTGLYRSAENEIAVTVDGTQKYNFTSEGLKFNGTSLDGTPFMGAIDKDITDTAVDVFVYDTSRDSDGGAWRKRTQHTSWYNEELNTATRGSRREFPSVVVIVVEQYKVTIYDGDDPDLPMWMVFLSGGSYNWSGTTRDLTSIYMLNGILVCGYGGSGAGAREITFTSDIIRVLYSTDYKPNGGIKTRNDSVSWGSGETRLIVNDIINDVAMTVLPTAPIDPDTGLQVPTIAVATDGGVSVIKDDGTVVDGFTSITSIVGLVRFDGNKVIYAADNDSEYKWIYQFDIPSTDNTGNSYLIDPNSIITNYNHNVDFSTYSAVPLHYTGSDDQLNYTNDIALSNSNEIFVGAGRQLAKVQFTDSDYNTRTSLFSSITSTYNTGWQTWNIKGAFLSDTDATNLVATDLELITNGSFSSDSNWTKDASWTISGGNATNSGNGNLYQEISVVSGRRYLMKATFDFTGDTSIVNTSWGFRELDNSAYYASVVSWTPNAVNQGVLYWTSTVTGNILARCFSQDGVSIDNWSVQDITDGNSDRSVNGKGLQVFGTVTKTPVATGAELVAYSGFNDSNYLYQPLNSDMAFGTGDFSYIYWFKAGTAARERIYLSFDNWVGSSRTGSVIHLRYNANGRLTNYFSDDGFSTYDTHNGNRAINDNNWHCVVSGKRGDRWVLYIDGEFDSSIPIANASETMTNSTAYTMIGKVGSASGYGFVEGSLSLMRVSLSIPSEEQIKKIYEDEKVLFQENAIATLYGSSDAVTALAYDEKTNLLHVGTSSGRSDFNGLRRINNTTEAVTTAISAYDGSIAQQ